jgi:hypothetical protein
MKTNVKPIILAFGLGLLLIVPQKSSGFYNPSTGRWISRDPAEEEGGPSLYAFAENSPAEQSDFLGLWASADHKSLTRDSLSRSRMSGVLGDYFTSYFLDWIIYWDLQQDDGSAFTDNRRHFNRNIDKPMGSRAEEFRRAYSAYISDETKRFNEALSLEPAQYGKADIDQCEKALESIGRLMHSWQDYYAHALIHVKGKGNKITADRTLWTRKPPIRGSPDNPAGGSGQIIPSSWNSWMDPGEHGWSEISGAEGNAREEDARNYGAQKLAAMVPTWASSCRCWFTFLSNPPEHY